MKKAATKVVNLGQLTRSHNNRWVALKPVSGKVVATATSIVALSAKFAQGIPSDVVVHRVLPPQVRFAPQAL